MDFYSVSVQSPPAEQFDNQRIIQLAQIETWNFEVMEVHWIPETRNILISVGDEWFLQPDNANIVTSIAALFSCDDYQIRILDLTISKIMASPEELWGVYTGNWLYYADNNVILQFRADVDYDAEQAPQWVDIVPDSQPNAPLPEFLIE
jgi:hypothetical protein